ncbi:hypothetical protein FDN13_06415 [Caloramator sp. E03]|uniref:hypothetical protein n=1 Tax=Caloramator sp. E03 TaxID=2576307 RepID=UPI001110E581|nr:hypothetical protein [Caloramator sp. E03]QCX33369.1 hypothetical protein FDN13_06415 [Caloramator sp. E03]
MRRILLSGLVVIITLITVIAMTTFKNSYVPETLNNEYEQVVNYDLSEGPGYIFDDFGKEINIPIE